MYLKDHDQDNPTICPLTRMPCMEHRCEWWRRTDPQKYESCVIWDIHSTLKSLYFESTD